MPCIDLQACWQGRCLAHELRIAEQQGRAISFSFLSTHASCAARSAHIPLQHAHTRQLCQHQPSQARLL